MKGEHMKIKDILTTALLCSIICSGGMAKAAPDDDTSDIVPCDLDPNEQCIEITLDCTPAGWFNQKCLDSETIQIPHGRPIYALLVSGFAQNKGLDMFHWYNFARCLQEKNAYVHYAWWNNLLAPYMERPLHNPASIPSTQDHPRHDTEGQYNGLTWSILYPIFKVPGTENFPTKAIPAEDHQFQADAEVMLKAIRKHHPKAVIILVGHSMGGNAITRLADNMPDDFVIDLVAPIDPVGNRTCLPTYPPSGNFLNHCSGNNHFTRYHAVREDWFWAPVPVREFGTNIKYLYHRYQTESLPPYWDWGWHRYFGYTSATRETSIDIDSTNIQAEVNTEPRSGEDVPPSHGGPNYGGGLDGHGEIVGFRGARFDWDPSEWLGILQSSYPLALDASESWPSLTIEREFDDENNHAVRDFRVHLLREWESDPNYLDDNGWGPLKPPEEYCEDQKNLMAEGGEDKDYCTYCMVSGDLCTILKTKLDIPVNLAPVANAGPDQNVECSGPNGTEVTLDGSGSTDHDDDPLTFTWDWPDGVMTGETIYPYLPVGTHSFTLTVDDGEGNTDTDTVYVTVMDSAAPSLSVSLSPDILWPSNHKMVDFTASIQVSDSCDDSPMVELVSIISNEAENGIGNGNTSDDIQGANIGTDDRAFSLRAERAGKGFGDRIYTITYEIMDASGNVTDATAEVTVLHDRGHRSK
jgi:pimeloyl-ACP methyl ester carboxylesterase